MKKEPTYWLSSLTVCDICSADFGDTMYDAATRQGPWGNLCEACFKAHGRGLGLGRGQKYKKQEDGNFLCVEGL